MPIASVSTGGDGLSVLHLGLIIGITLGGAFLIAVLVWYWRRQRRSAARVLAKDRIEPLQLTVRPAAARLGLSEAEGAASADSVVVVHLTGENQLPANVSPAVSVPNRSDALSPPPTGSAAPLPSASLLQARLSQTSPPPAPILSIVHPLRPTAAAATPPSGISANAVISLQQARQDAAEYRRMGQLALKLGLEGGALDATTFVTKYHYSPADIDAIIHSP